MERIVKLLLGVDSESWSDRAAWQLEYNALPQGDAALLILSCFVALAVGLWSLYRWEAPSLSVGMRGLLTACRIGTVMCAIAMLIEPVIVLSKTEHIPSHVLVMLDSSQSMGLRDAWKDDSQARSLAESLNLEGGDAAVRKMTRLELASELLKGDLVDTIAQNGDRIVHIHPFAERLGEEFDPRSASPLQVQGQTTSIGSSLRQAVLAYRGMPLAGVVLISDGQSNSGESLRAAARFVGDEAIPIFAITAGTGEGPRNAAIASMETAPIIFERDTNHIHVSVQSRGISDTPVTVTLDRRRGDEEWHEFATQELMLDDENPQQTVSFPHSETELGRAEFRARLSDVGPELTADDNVALAEVRVIRQKLRTLLIAGSTFPEVQFLRNTLLRDKTIELSTWLMSADEMYEHPGDKPIRQLPTTDEELNQFDCVLLYDPNPSRWPANFGDLLTQFVGQAGGGLVYVAGEMQTASLFENQDEPELAWLSLLPIVRETGLFRTQVQMRLSARHAWNLRITDEGQRDTVFAFDEDPVRNQQILMNLPGMFWHFPVTRAKPGATVLARHGDPRMRNEFGPEVLLATQLVGPGRSFFVGFDRPYRWRYLDEQFFDGFWARLIARAGRNKQLGGVYPFRLATDRSSYRPGNQVRLVARFSDPSELDPGLKNLPGEIEHGDAPPVPITLEPGRNEGEFETTFTVNRAGPHFVRVWAGDDTSRSLVKASTLKLDVELPNLEFETPTLDRARLESVARETGGRVFEMTEADQLANALTIGRVARQLEDRQEIWDCPLLFGTLFLLLLTEWLVRKRCRLV